MSKSPTLAEMQAARKVLNELSTETRRKELELKNKAAAREQLLAISLLIARSRTH
jgi:hypothetical protein